MNSRSEWTSIGSCQDHKNLELFERESASLSKQASEKSREHCQSETNTEDSGEPKREREEDMLISFEELDIAMPETRSTL